MKLAKRYPITLVCQTLEYPRSLYYYQTKERDDQALIEAIAADGTKVVMTTHDLGQARRLAEEVLFMHKGELSEHSPASCFFEKPGNEAAAAFLNGELIG